MLVSNHSETGVETAQVSHLSRLTQNRYPGNTAERDLAHRHIYLEIDRWYTRRGIAAAKWLSWNRTLLTDQQPKMRLASGNVRNCAKHAAAIVIIPELEAKLSPPVQREGTIRARHLCAGYEFCRAGFSTVTRNPSLVAQRDWTPCRYS